MKKLLPIILGLALSSSAFAVDELKDVDAAESFQIRGTQPNERFIEERGGRTEDRRDRKEEKKARKEEKKERREAKKERREERREYEVRRESTQPVEATRMLK